MIPASFPGGDTNPMGTVSEKVLLVWKSAEQIEHAELLWWPFEHRTQQTVDSLTAYSCIFMFKGEIFLGLNSSLREKSNLLQITHLIYDLNRHISGECSFSVVSWIKHHFCFISMAHLEKKRKQINEAVLTIQYHKNSQCTEVSESDPCQHLHIESENTMMRWLKCSGWHITNHHVTKHWLLFM